MKFSIRHKASPYGNFLKPVEEEFEAHWERWLDQADKWKPFFLELEGLKEIDLKAALHSFDLITDEDSERFSRLRRSAEGRAVPCLFRCPDKSRHRLPRARICAW